MFPEKAASGCGDGGGENEEGWSVHGEALSRLQGLSRVSGGSPPTTTWGVVYQSL